MKGKPLTLMAKCLSVLIVIGGFVLKVLVWKDLPVDDLLKVAAFVAFVFGPVDLSLLAQNIFNRKEG